MKRELKFRAWDGTEMFYSSHPSNILLIESDGWRLGVPDYDWNLEFGAYSVNESDVLMQSTGLIDMHGEEIYESDIVNTDVGVPGIVKFSHGVFGIEWQDDKGKYMTGSWGQLHNLRRMDDDIIERIFVIGNVHEHPHLCSPVSGQG
jgi:uncharacterized phage protein (TIGR01671 family)